MIRTRKKQFCRRS